MNKNGNNRGVRFTEGDVLSSSTDSRKGSNGVISTDQGKIKPILKKESPPQSPTSSNETESSSNSSGQSIGSGSSWLSIFGIGSDGNSTNSTNSNSNIIPSWLQSAQPLISSTLSSITSSASSLLSELKSNFSDTPTPESSPNNSGNNSPQTIASLNSQDGGAVNISSTPLANFSIPPDKKTPSKSDSDKTTQQQESNFLKSTLLFVTGFFGFSNRKTPAPAPTNTPPKTSTTDEFNNGVLSKTRNQPDSLTKSAFNSDNDPVRKKFEEEQKRKIQELQAKIRENNENIKKIEDSELWGYHKYYESDTFKRILSDAYEKITQDRNAIKADRNIKSPNKRTQTDFAMISALRSDFIEKNKKQIHILQKNLDKLSNENLKLESELDEIRNVKHEDKPRDKEAVAVFSIGRGSPADTHSLGRVHNQRPRPSPKSKKKSTNQPSIPLSRGSKTR